MSICWVDNCGKPKQGHGLCAACLQHQKKHGGYEDIMRRYELSKAFTSSMGPYVFERAVREFSHTLPFATERQRRLFLHRMHDRYIDAVGKGTPKAMGRKQ